MSKLMPNERYTLTLKHELVDELGAGYELDEPITVSYVVVASQTTSASIVINDMMRRLQTYLLQTIEEKK